MANWEYEMQVVKQQLTHSGTHDHVALGQQQGTEQLRYEFYKLIRKTCHCVELQLPGSM